MKFTDRFEEDQLAMTGLSVNFWACLTLVLSTNLHQIDAVSKSNRFIFAKPFSVTSERSMSNITNSLLEKTQVRERLDFIIHGSQKLELKLSSLILTGVSHSRMEKRAEWFVVRELTFLLNLICVSIRKGCLRNEALGVLRGLDQQWRFSIALNLHINSMGPFVWSQSAKCLGFNFRLVGHSRGIFFTAVAVRLLQIVTVRDLNCIVKLCRRHFRLATRVSGIWWLAFGSSWRKRI